MLIVTVAFNEEELIRKQAQLIREHVTDSDYQHIVIDNSSDKTKRERIMKVCMEEYLEYVATPAYLHKLTLPSIFWDGMSHGAALNWAFYHVINPIKPECFTIVDHDLLPFSDINLTERIGRRNYIGVEQTRENGWYLWPGFSIFNYEYIAKQEPNFLPVYVKSCYFDAGGGNYLRFYKRQDPTSMEFIPVKTYRIKRTNELKSYNDIYHGDCIQIIDNSWLHAINGSNYAHIKGKGQTVEDIISNIGKYIRYAE